MPNSIRVLAIGDVVGKAGRNAILENIDKLKEKYNADLLIVNVENTSHGDGLLYKHYLQYRNTKIDVMTMGNHTFGKKEIYDYIDKTDNLLIPANFTDLDAKFDSHKEYSFKFKDKIIKVVNILGDHAMNFPNKESCFTYFDKIYDDKYIYIVDFHSEITAEKNVFGYYFDGKASLIFGTHTHVQTADERILPQGCAYISDVGMCGSKDSVIGYDYISYVERMKHGTPTTVSTRRPMMINGVLVEMDLDTKKAMSICRINEIVE